jgi:hypothetical protein
MTGRNFGRERAHRQAVEDRRELPGLIAPVLRDPSASPRAPALSKEELRAQGTAAVAAWVANHGTPPAGRKTDRKNPRARPTLKEPVLVARWSKNRRGHTISLRFATLETVNVIDLRTFLPDGEGHLTPGRGFCASISHLPRLAKELAAAVQRAVELGLIDAAEAAP